MSNGGPVSLSVRQVPGCHSLAPLPAGICGTRMETLAMRPLFAALPSQQHCLPKHSAGSSSLVAATLPHPLAWEGVSAASCGAEDARWSQSSLLSRSKAGGAFGFGTGRAFASRNGNHPTADHAVLFEVEGVLSDVHRFGHRLAFNVGFQELGLECANWSEPVYLDLLRRSGGVEEKMLHLFFDQIGWPSSLPSEEKDVFAGKLVAAKREALLKLATTETLPLRPGIDKFVDEVLQADLPLVIITAYSRCGESVASSIVDKLGKERSKKVKVVGEAEVENSAYGKVVFGSGILNGTDEQLAAEAAKAVVAEKQRMAEEVASLLKLSVELDSSFTEVSKRVVAALRAGAETAGVEAHNCILLSGSYVGIQAAAQIGMPCVVVRSSVTARAEYPAARAAIDGFGPGALTLSRLLRYI